MPDRLAALRTATGAALAAAAAQRSAREGAEAVVDAPGADALRRERDALRAQVRSENVTLKQLIDRLRTLHRDLGVICDSQMTDGGTAKPLAGMAAGLAGEAGSGASVAMDATPGGALPLATTD